MPRAVMMITDAYMTGMLNESLAEMRRLPIPALVRQSPIAS